MFEPDQFYWVRKKGIPPSGADRFKEWRLCRCYQDDQGLSWLVSPVNLDAIALSQFDLEEYEVFLCAPPKAEPVLQERTWICQWVTTEHQTYPEHYKTHNPKVDHVFCASHFLSYQLNRWRHSTEQGQFSVKVQDLATQTNWLIVLKLTPELLPEGGSRVRRELVSCTEIQRF